VSAAAGLLAAPLWLAAAGAALGDTPAPQKIAVEARGPLALVTVTRDLPSEGSGERLVDVALPDGAALVDVAVSQRGSWRGVPPTPRERATREYLARLDAQGVAPAREPYDDATTLRVRVAADPRAALALRYRFALLPEIVDGRRRVRFPAAPERLPAPADVTASIADARDVTIAGSSGTHGHTSTRSGWEVSWSPRATRSRVEARLAWAGSNREAVSALSVEARGTAPRPPPASVLFVIDRSRSVGLPGLAAERDLAGRMLEALPPSTRFDVLFFDRSVRRLFPMSRPATREALDALDAEMVPDRMRNGTDLVAALRAAGELLRREASAFSPRAWLVLITDGALPDADRTIAGEGVLGSTPGLELQVATFVVRASDDDPAPANSISVLARLPSVRSGILREVRDNELGDALAAALAALARGGDAMDVRWYCGGCGHVMAWHLAPGEGRGIVIPSGPRPTEVTAWVNGDRLRLLLPGPPGDAGSLRALVAKPGPNDARLLETSELAALVETPIRPAAPVEPPVRGRLDRDVVRTALSLAYMPRARACYLNRTAATLADRDLAGRVRLAIDLTRGEVGSVVLESSTLHNPSVEACLRDGAFELEVPRTLRSDSPSTAVLNLVFRPRTPEKSESPAEAALGEQIDLVIEELHRSEPAPAEETPPPDRSMIPTR
jgi:hypothetical protein